MARPSTEAEYLARMVPSSAAGVSRRSVLRGARARALSSRHHRCSPRAAAAARPEAAAGDRPGDRHREPRLQPVGRPRPRQRSTVQVMDAFQKANSGHGP